MRHELVHVLVDEIGGGKTPRWLAEGMALHFAGEGRLLERNQRGNSISLKLSNEHWHPLNQPPKCKQLMQWRITSCVNWPEARVEGESEVWKTPPLEAVTQKSSKGA